MSTSMFSGGMGNLYGGYNPYMGYQGYNPYQNQYNPYQMGNYGMYGGGMGGQQYGGYGGLWGGFNPWMMGGQQPMYGQQGGYGDFFNQFDTRMNDLFSKYFAPQTTGTAKDTGATSSGSGSTTTTNTTTPAGGTTTPPAAPDFGNIGQRLDKGQTITKQAEQKLNKMGYTDQQIIDANQGGTGMANFQKNLGAMTPGVIKAPAIKAPNPNLSGAK